MNQPQPPTAHSAGWITQTYISFAVALAALTVGIVSALYAVTSSISLAKTVRDQHESSRVVARVDEARFERLLTEHDPFKAPV